MGFDAIGVSPANLTARNADNTIDIEQTKQIVRFLYAKGVDGLHVCGTTGEFASLTVSQRKAILEACIDAAAGQGTILVQVGAVSTDDSCELARHAAQTGAQAISSVPPYYYPANDEMVLTHYRRIAEAGNLPVIIYDNPSTTGYTKTVEIARQLAAEGAVHGIKLARQDMYALARLADLSEGAL